MYTNTNLQHRPRRHHHRRRHERRHRLVQVSGDVAPLAFRERAPQALLQDHRRRVAAVRLAGDDKAVHLACEARKPSRWLESRVPFGFTTSHDSDMARLSCVSCTVMY